MIVRCKILFPYEGKIPLRASLLGCGHEKRHNLSYRLEGSRRGGTPLLIWQYTLAGRGAIRIGQEEYPLPPGTAFLLPPCDYTYYLPDASTGWELLYLTLSGDELLRLGQDIVGEYGNVLTFQENSPTVRLAWDILDQVSAAPPVSPYRASALSYEFVLTMLHELENESVRHNPGSALLDRVAGYLAAHIGEQFTIAGLSRRLGYSRSHFSRLFHSASGQSPQSYILDMRLQFAARLIETSRRSVKETAVDSGFSDPNYFCRVFRRKYGVSPGEYRRR